MNDDNKKDSSEAAYSRYYPRTGIIIDGEVFPFSLSCEEYDDYLKFLEERKKENKE